jgi:hypothetical protein
MFLQQGLVKIGILAAFPTSMDFLDESDTNEPPFGTQSNIMQHLENMSAQFLSYLAFLTAGPGSGSEWIFSPFSAACISKTKITDYFQENLLDMMTDHQFQAIFKEKPPLEL